MEEVKSLLSRTRLLTLTGSGGCGKSRLSLQVAADVLENYPDGVWLVELAALSDPALVPQAVASVLGLQEEGNKPLLQTLVTYLKTRRLLVIIDNCEHVLDACARLADTLLKNCPNVQMIASSREALGIAGEQTFRIPSLSLPDAQHVQTVESVSQYEAVRLFVERALSVQSQFTVTNASAPALAQLCVRLDGIPLAIELAAARVRSLSVEEINARLDNRFRLLTGGSRTALPRQQTLRALVDWSFDLLSDDEKALFLHLSVFAGGWTLEAAEHVFAGNNVEGWEVLGLLTSLVDKSLVVPDQEDEHTRYRLLETVRQYAGDRLLESGAAKAVRERHQAFFAKLAEEANEKLTGPEQGLWLNRLETEHDNLRQALTFCFEAAEGGEIGLRLGAALSSFWAIRGHMSEGRERLSALLARSEAQEHTKARADACKGAGWLSYNQGDYTSARSLYEESLEIYKELGDRMGIAISLNNLGDVACDQGDYTSARSLYAESLAIRRELGDKQGIAMSYNNLGNVAQHQGDYASARSLHQESLEIYKGLGDRKGLANVVASYARLNAKEEKRKQAARLWGAAERLREEISAPIATNEQNEYDRDVAAARQALGEDAFAAAWSEGRAMTMEQAIKCAHESAA